MKPFQTLMAIALLFLTSAVWAQNNSPEPPTPNPGPVTAGPAIAGQITSDALPPPRAIMMQRRDVGPEGPENATFMTVGGHGPGEGLGEWWKNPEIVSKLQLSEEQVKKISETSLDHKLKLIDLQADLEKQELRLQPLLDLDQPDGSKVGAQIDLITTARGRLEKENTMMMLDIRRWLSVEQWKKLKSLEATEERKKVFFFREFNTEGPLPPPLPGDLPVRIR
jgi:Spy/CpxP family protein refolding chaperone